VPRDVRDLQLSDSPNQFQTTLKERGGGQVDGKMHKSTTKNFASWFLRLDRQRSAGLVYNLPTATVCGTSGWGRTTVVGASKTKCPAWAYPTRHVHLGLFNRRSHLSHVVVVVVVLLGNRACALSPTTTSYCVFVCPLEVEDGAVHDIT
jgi:hypothetical protein